MNTPEKCPNCGADKIAGTRTGSVLVYSCLSEQRNGRLVIVSRCAIRKEAKDEDIAARQKAENELDETLHRIKERGEEIERLRGEKCAAQGEAERERLARIKMHDEMERQACLATELRTELAETRRKLEEVALLVRTAVGTRNDMLAAYDGEDQTERRAFYDAMDRLEQWAEKGGGVCLS